MVEVRENEIYTSEETKSLLKISQSTFLRLVKKRVSSGGLVTNLLVTYFKVAVVRVTSLSTWLSVVTTRVLLFMPTS